MPHPSLGLPPPDFAAGHPEAGAQLRRERARIARLALESSVHLAPDLAARYDEIALRHFLRDYDRHIEQLARALETDDDSWVTNYAEWLVPVYRRREVPMKDAATLLLGLRDAVVAVLSADEAQRAVEFLQRWRTRYKRHQAIPGDHRGNPVVRFFWKGAGVLDDDIV
jgi:hypothetical protein